VFFALTVAGAALCITGVGLFAAGCAAFATTGAPAAIALFGAAFLVFGIGLLFIWGNVCLCRVAFRGIKTLVGKFLVKNKRYNKEVVA